MLMTVFRKYYNPLVMLMDQARPLMLLIIRLWIAKIFFSAGLVKIADFDTTIALFHDEYMVPLIPPVFAAVMATIFELSCPVLLTGGLLTRLAALPLLGMTAVIQFTYDQNIQHFFWAVLLGTLIAFGGGRLSLDHWLKLEQKPTI